MPLQCIDAAKMHKVHHFHHYYIRQFSLETYLSSGALGFGASYTIKVGTKLHLKVYFSTKTVERLQEASFDDQQKQTIADRRLLLF